MKEFFYKALSAVLTVVFLAGLGMVVYKTVDYIKARESHSQAQQLAFSPTAATQPAQPQPTQPTEVPEATQGETAPTEAPRPTEKPLPEVPMDEAAALLQGVNIAALQQVNADVLGWIYVPDSVINYPLLESHDRDTYLHTAWDGTASQSGSIFLEQENCPSLTDFNSIVYGHHMGDGSMFAAIANYRYPAYAAAHPYVYIATEESIYRYRTFAFYEAEVKSHTYRVWFPDSASKEAALYSYLQHRLPDAPQPDATDRILTLSTCTGGDYDSRWVLQAVLEARWEK